MAKRHLPVALLVLAIFGCSKPERTMLEFRIAEEQPAPGLTEMKVAVDGKPFYLHDEVAMNEADVDSAVAILNDGRWVVDLALTSAGAKKFEALTESNVGKHCGMVLDGELVSAPRIMAPIRQGRALIVSDFTEAEARRIARDLSRP